MSNQLRTKYNTTIQKAQQLLANSQLIKDSTSLQINKNTERMMNKRPNESHKYTLNSKYNDHSNIHYDHLEGKLKMGKDNSTKLINSLRSQVVELKEEKSKNRY